MNRLVIGFDRRSLPAEPRLRNESDGTRTRDLRAGGHLCAAQVAASCRWSPPLRSRIVPGPEL